MQKLFIKLGEDGSKFIIETLQISARQFLWHYTIDGVEYNAKADSLPRAEFGWQEVKAN